MNPDRWRKIEQIYNAALELQPDRRDAYLAEACAGDDSLREEVEALLRNSSGTEDFMKGPALEFAAKALAEDQANQQSKDHAGSTIAHYRTSWTAQSSQSGSQTYCVDAQRALPSVFAGWQKDCVRF